MSKLIELLRKKSPENDSQLLALAITLILWLVVLAIGIFVPFDFLKNKEPVYQSISLNLAPLSASSSGRLSQVSSNSPTQEFSQAPAREPVPTRKPVPAQTVAQAPAREPVPAQTAAQAPAREPVPAQTAAQAPTREPVPAPASELAPSAPILTPEVTEPVDVDSFDEADWEALFAQGGSRSYSNSNRKSTSEQQTTSSSSGLSGSAATTNSASNSSTTGTSASSSQNMDSGEQSLAQDTESALGRIATAASGERNSSLSSGISSSPSSVSGSRAQSGTAMNLVGGGVRQLLHPSEPKITISEKNQSLIPGSVEVSITFDITPQGLVLPNSIKITPESLVHPLVQSEIKEQIGNWRFQVAEGSGQVHFKYNIMKK